MENLHRMEREVTWGKSDVDPEDRNRVLMITVYTHPPPGPLYCPPAPFNSNQYLLGKRRQRRVRLPS